MIHPMIIHGGDSTVLAVCGDYLRRLLAKPRPILWVRADDYRWVPIECVGKAVDNYYKFFGTTPHNRLRMKFRLDETVEIPREAGDVIVKYNGHED